MRPTLLVLSLLLAPGVRAGDWPQLLGPTRDGVSPETGLLAAWPAPGPPILWQRAVGEGYSGPVVAGGKVIVFHRGDGREVVEALDAASGRPLWKHDYACAYRDDYGKGNGPRATPSVAGKHVYTLGAEGDLHCLELDTGKAVWTRSLGEFQPRKVFFGIGTSPLVEGNLLVVNVGARGAGVVAFDRTTGKEVWKATDQEASYASPVAATVDGVRHLVCFTRDGLLSLDPKDGAVRLQRRWRARINASVNAATPLVLDGHAFISASYNTGALLARLKKDTLEEVWQGDEVLSNHYNTPVRSGDFLFGIDGRQEEGARLRCVEWKTGKVRWTREAFGCASLLLAEGRLFALTEGGELVLFAAVGDSYRELARAAVLAGPCRAAPALADGRLFVRDDGKLVCLNLRK